MGVDFPTNDFTRMIESVASGNRSGVRAGGLASATPLPTVRSADLGSEVPAEPELSLEERIHLDQLAREAGIQDVRLGTAQPDHGSQYASFEDALAAGASVNPPTFEEPTQEIAPQGLGRPSAREYLGGAFKPRPALIEVPRLPDFRKVEGIDLTGNRVIVDGMDFPITDEEATEFKQFVVGKAHAAITERLSEALGLFASAGSPEVPNGGTAAEGEAAAVQQHDQGSGPESSV